MEYRRAHAARSGIGRTFVPIFLLLTLFFGSPVQSFEQEYRDVLPGYRVKLPDDIHFKEDYRVQWWYFTGHLNTEDKREFGYEITFFAVNVQKKEFESRFGLNTLFISHFALSDIEGQEYYYRESMDGGAFGFSGAKRDRLSVWVGDDLLEGSLEKLRLKAAGQGRAVDLTLVPEKPYVLNGDAGFSRKSSDDPLLASIYISNTDLETVGTVKIGGRSIGVRGKSWFDREISSRGQLGNLKGWDWFAIQLDDGREIMLYQLRKKDGSIDDFSTGTFVGRDGTYRILKKDEFFLRPLGHYRSKKTGARYPSSWTVRVPGEKVDLTVTPLIQDQEFVAPFSTGNYYWEGACRVEGSATGRAYVELTGYPGDQ